MSLYNDAYSAEEHIKFRSSVATAMATRKLTEQKYNQAIMEVNKWRSRVDLAQQKNNEDLANRALEQEEIAIANAKMLKKQLDEQSVHVDNLKSQLNERESRISHTKINNKALNSNRAIAAFEQTEENILIREAQVKAREELIAKNRIE